MKRGTFIILCLVIALSLLYSPSSNVTTLGCDLFRQQGDGEEQIEGFCHPDNVLTSGSSLDKILLTYYYENIQTIDWKAGASADFIHITMPSLSNNGIRTDSPLASNLITKSELSNEHCKFYYFIFQRQAQTITYLLPFDKMQGSTPIYSVAPINLQDILALGGRSLPQNIIQAIIAAKQGLTYLLLANFCDTVKYVPPPEAGPTPYWEGYCSANPQNCPAKCEINIPEGPQRFYALGVDRDNCGKSKIIEINNGQPFDSTSRIQTQARNFINSCSEKYEIEEQCIICNFDENRACSESCIQTVIQSKCDDLMEMGQYEVCKPSVPQSQSCKENLCADSEIKDVTASILQVWDVQHKYLPKENDLKLFYILDLKGWDAKKAVADELTLKIRLESEYVDAPDIHDWFLPDAWELEDDSPFFKARTNIISGLNKQIDNEASDYQKTYYTGKLSERRLIRNLILGQRIDLSYLSLSNTEIQDKARESTDWNIRTGKYYIVDTITFKFKPINEVPPYKSQELYNNYHTAVFGILTGQDLIKQKAKCELSDNLYVVTFDEKVEFRRGSDNAPIMEMNAYTTYYIPTVHTVSDIRQIPLPKEVIPWHEVLNYFYNIRYDEVLTKTLESELEDGTKIKVYPYYQGGPFLYGFERLEKAIHCILEKN